MPTTIQLPAMPEQAQAIDPRTGKWSGDWYLYLKALDKIIRELSE